ncbi:MAG: 2-amino-4-hydroxy-6-hydroxymethyldihydropteridine diphosphokinase, partial [Microbacterium sp.]
MSRDLAQDLSAELPSRRTAPTAVVVALGSNLGDRGDTIASAVAALARLPLTEVTAVADTMESVALTPSGPDPSAPPYLNTVVLLSTRLAPTVL